jgi:hypothetical protein
MCRPCLYTAQVYRDDVTLDLGRYYIYGIEREFLQNPEKNYVKPLNDMLGANPKEYKESLINRALSTIL